MASVNRASFSCIYIHIYGGGGYLYTTVRGVGNERFICVCVPCVVTFRFYKTNHHHQFHTTYYMMCFVGYVCMYIEQSFQLLYIRRLERSQFLFCRDISLYTYYTISFRQGAAHTPHTIRRYYYTHSIYIYFVRALYEYI